MYFHLKQFEARRQEVERRLEHIYYTTPDRRRRRTRLPRAVVRVAAYASGR